MRQLGVLMTATQKRLLLALTAVTAPATATPTASRERFQGLSFLPGFNGEEAMKLRICRLFAIAALVFCCFAGAQALAQNAYITNLDANTVSVIDTTSNTVAATIPVGSAPWGVAVSPDGSTVYVANFIDGTVSVIATATDTVTATIPVGITPFGVAVFGAVFVTNSGDNTVSVIDPASNTVTAVIPVGIAPRGVAVTPDGSTVYVANEGDNTVSVIGEVTATIPGFSQPVAFGVFIGPPPVLATPPSGTACNGCSTAPSRAR